MPLVDLFREKWLGNLLSEKWRLRRAERARGEESRRNVFESLNAKEKDKACQKIAAWLKKTDSSSNHSDYYYKLEAQKRIAGFRWHLHRFNRPFLWLEKKIIEPLERSPGTDYVARRVSLISVVISALSIFFSVKTAREQAAILQIPAVSVYFRWEIPVPEDGQDPYSTVLWNIENTGNGPAVVKSAKLFVPATGKLYDMASDEAFTKLRDLLKDHFKNSEVVGYDVAAIAPGYAIARGAEWSLFKLSFQNIDEELVRKAEVVTLAICHCSIATGECQYDDSDPNPNPDTKIIKDCSGKEDINKLLPKS